MRPISSEQLRRLSPLLLLLLAPANAWASDNDALIASVVFGSILILIFLFVIARELFCWYWKINERLAVLREIRDLLRERSPTAGSLTSSAASAPVSPGTRCPGCGRQYDEDLSGQFCEACGHKL